MPACDSDAVILASVRKRSRKVGSVVNSLFSTFTATCRPSSSSSARQTSPMPPMAIRLMSRYRPPSWVFWVSEVMP